MKRRDFLKTTAPFATLPVLMNGLPIHALGNPETMNILSKAFVNTSRFGIDSNEWWERWIKHRHPNRPI